MKRQILVLLVVFVFCFSAVYSLASQATQAAKKPVQHKTFVGTVETLTMGDTAKGTKTELVVVNEAKQKMTFVVTAATVVHDSQGKATAVDKCKAGTKVSVKYTTTAEGVNDAISIKILT